jgi:2-dehydropantoate 2-reductase
MRIVIYGAGAIGGYLGARLSAAGVDVTLVGRGKHREVMAAQGLRIENRATQKVERVKVNAVLPGEEKPPYDVVFVTLKAHQVESNAERIAALRAKDGCYVILQNGLPWWYFDGIDSPYAGKPLKTLDPNGNLARIFPSKHVIGGVIFKPIDLYEPGALRHADATSDRIVIGEVDNRPSPRGEALAKVVTPAGWKMEVSTDIRTTIWTKLVSNAVWNPLCALTQSAANDIALFPPTRALAIAMMKEAIAVAKAAGAKINVDAEKAVGDVATRKSPISSTLADVRAGRQLELPALSWSIIEVGEITGVPTPNLRNVAACAGMLDQYIVNSSSAIRPASVG